MCRKVYPIGELPIRTDRSAFDRKRHCAVPLPFERTLTGRFPGPQEHNRPESSSEPNSSPPTATARCSSPTSSPASKKWPASTRGRIQDYRRAFRVRCRPFGAGCRGGVLDLGLTPQALRFRPFGAGRMGCCGARGSAPALRARSIPDRGFLRCAMYRQPQGAGSPKNRAPRKHAAPAPKGRQQAGRSAQQVFLVKGDAVFFEQPHQLVLE
jgi:hypothetical protein